MAKTERLRATTTQERGNPLVLTGVRHGRLVGVRCVGTSSQGRVWLCQCDCGETCERTGRAFASGRQQSCGCLQKEAAAGACRSRSTHGQTGSRLYTIWRGMISRCERRRATNFADYGGRGISVCPEWRGSFEAFAAWAEANGYADGLTIDREDTNGDYHPGNCRWAGRKAQARNRRSGRFVTFDGQTKTVAEWAELTGTRMTTILYRLNAGWPVQAALYEAPDQGRRFA